MMLKHGSFGFRKYNSSRFRLTGSTKRLLSSNESHEDFKNFLTSGIEGLKKDIKVLKNDVEGLKSDVEYLNDSIKRLDSTTRGALSHTKEIDTKLYELVNKINNKERNVDDLLNILRSRENRLDFAYTALKYSCISLLCGYIISELLIKKMTSNQEETLDRHYPVQREQFKVNGGSLSQMVFGSSNNGEGDNHVNKSSGFVKPGSLN